MSRMRKCLVSGALSVALVAGSITALPTAGAQTGSSSDVAGSSADGSSNPSSVNPIELGKKELDGSSQMSSGLSAGDWDQFSQGAKQAMSAWLTIFVASIVLGQLVELVMRGLRMVQR